MVSTDASNKRIVKLFPSVACPLPTMVMEKIVGFPSGEQFECGLYCHKFKKALQLLLAKETGDFWCLFFSFFSFFCEVLTGKHGNQLHLKCLCLSTPMNFLPVL